MLSSNISQPVGSSLASTAIARTTKGSDSPSGTLVENSGTFVTNSGTYVVSSGTAVGSGSATGTSVMGTSVMGTSVMGTSHGGNFLADILKSMEPRYIPPPTLEQREAWPTDPSPALVRQARSGALPSVTRLLPSDASPRAAVAAKGLPTVDQFIARAGPAKTSTLSGRVMGMFGRATASERYEKLLTGLKNYHDACSQTRAGAGADAKAQLDYLAEKVDKYAQSSGSGSPLPAGMLQELRQQIRSESTALKNLQADLQGGASLPKGTTVSQALAFSREGVSLKDMSSLMDKGLKLDPSVGEKHLSGGHIKILAGLDQYHSSYAGHTLKASERDATVRALDNAVKLLEKLEPNTEKYLHAGNAPRASDPQAQAIQDLHDQIPLERRVLLALSHELKMGTPLPEGADLSHAMAFAREGISLDDMVRFMDSGTSPTQARKQLDTEQSERLTEQLSQLAPEQKKALLDDFTEKEIVLLEMSGLGIDGGKEYRRLDLPITPQTIVRTDDQEVGHMLPLGAGACNEVFAARYSTSEGIAQGVFKPLQNNESAAVARVIGINSELPQIANRNLATQDVARALGFNVVVDCQIGSRRPPGKPLELGLIMGRAAGKSAYDTPPEVFKQPEVRREITKLQLLDHLVGQADRHGSNYFIDVHQDASGQIQAKISGIDNDLCFGHTTVDGNQIAYDGDHDVGYRGTKMPELIDSDMASAIRSITPESLSTLLSDKLSPIEVQAAQSRLNSLLEHVNHLEANGQVITPTEWNARNEIDALHQPVNSYVGRDLETAVYISKERSMQRAG
ncbi:MAG: hypothetical protein ABWY08_20335 [Comamonas sp.]